MVAYRPTDTKAAVLLPCLANLNPCKTGQHSLQFFLGNLPPNLLISGGVLTVNTAQTVSKPRNALQIPCYQGIGQLRPVRSRLRPPPLIFEQMFSTVGGASKFQRYSRLTARYLLTVLSAQRPVSVLFVAVFSGAVD